MLFSTALFFIPLHIAVISFFSRLAYNRVQTTDNKALKSNKNYKLRRLHAVQIL